MSSPEQTQLDGAVEAAKEDACLVTDAAPAGALPSTTEKLSQQTATDENPLGGVTHNVVSDMQTDDPQTTPEGTSTYQQASPKEPDAPKSGKPQPRCHDASNHHQHSDDDIARYMKTHPPFQTKLVRCFVFFDRVAGLEYLTGALLRSRSIGGGYAASMMFGA